MTSVFRFFFDAAQIIGTVAFAASGAMLAIDRDLDLFGVLFLGVITAVGGGVLRDLLSKTVPAVLKKRIYAVASIIGAATYYYLVRLKAGAPIAMLSGMLITVLIRLLATHYAWNLPRVKRPE